MNDRDYHEAQYFEPADHREHEAACEGEDYNGVPSYDLDDPCHNCGAAFLSHSAGRCPK